MEAARTDALAERVARRAADRIAMRRRAAGEVREDVGRSAETGRPRHVVFIR